jgi:pimeloyl-ACP methyl ester carboxylesterase
MNRTRESDADSNQSPPSYLTKQRAIRLIGIALILPLAGAIYQFIATRRDKRKYAPPGKLVDVGGHRLHICCSGDEHLNTGPTVVMDAAWGDFSLTWSLVQPEVSKFARVCAYDRAGLGWSDSAQGPRTSKQIAKELHALLHNAGIPGPYVLVGHSFGAINARLFASQYPDEVAGMVLVDPAHEDQPMRYGKKARHSPILKIGLLSAPFGIPRLLLPIYATYHPAYARNCKFSRSTLSPYRAVLARTRHLHTSYDELVNIWESLNEARDAAESLEGMPLIVITAPLRGYPDENAIWMDMQEELARRSSKGKQVIAKSSGHYPHHDQPELVIQAVRDVLAASHKNKNDV